MEGPDSSLLFTDAFEIHELSGILPRAAEFLLKEIDRLKSQLKREYRLEISSLEIYCENLKDLYGESGEAAL